MASLRQHLPAILFCLAISNYDSFVTQISAILFYRTMPNFPFRFPTFPFLKRFGPTDPPVGYRQSQNFNACSIWCAGILYFYLFLKKISILFHLFQEEWKHVQSVFIANCSTNSRTVLRIMIKILELYQKFAAGKEVAAQLSFQFPGGKCVTWINSKIVEYL